LSTDRLPRWDIGPRGAFLVFRDLFLGEKKLRTQVVLSCLIAYCLFSFPQSFGQTSDQPEETAALQPPASPDSDLNVPDTAATDTASSADPQGSGKASGSVSGRAKPSAGSVSTSTTYVFPTSGDMNRYWLKNTLGPKAWAGAAFTASWNQWITDSPKEWTKDATGWGQRFGSSLLDNAINTTTLVWTSRAMGQDPRYRRCDCTGLWPRSRHAIILAVTAYNRNGDLKFSPPKIIAPYTGPLVTRNTIYPDRFGTGDAFSGGVYYLAGGVAWNFVREFIFRFW
jgi:hypothetical protein